MASAVGSIDIKDVGAEKILQVIQGKLAAHRAHLNLLNLHRRQVLNDYLDLKGNIRVFCRIRPSLPLENSHTQSTVFLNDTNVLLKIENKRKTYNFDKVFHTDSTQEEVFSEVEPVIKSALDGYNVCIFAYGQTGTGKTFTMEGRSDCPGVVPRAMGSLFVLAQSVDCKLTFGFSMLEIYMGRLRDLLVPRAKTLVQRTPCLSIQMDHSGSIEIENLIEIKISNFEQVEGLYRSGSRLRSTTSTMSNATSSRSHCLIRISIASAVTERRRTTNKIWMVDLGGSERLLKTQARGKTLEEGKAINLSLSALGDVISSLHNKKSHVPYRNSKLTQVLRDCLGEDSKTLMLVHVSPKEEDSSETSCALGFAMRVRGIHLGQDESPGVKDQKEFLMTELLQKLSHLESESQYIMKDIEELNENIKKLNEQFEDSRKKDTLNNEYQDAASCLNAEDENFSMETRQDTRIVKGVSINLPRFMRPTVCSRHKNRMNQFSENMRKKQRIASKRAQSVYTEPVTCNTEGGEDVLSLHDGSERTSELGHINWKNDIDAETECSQELSECEVKRVIFLQQQTPSSFKSPENCQADIVQQKKHLEIDDWLLFQSRDIQNTLPQQCERVFSLPEPPELEQHKRFSELISDIMNYKIDTPKYLTVTHCTARRKNNYDHKSVDFFVNAEGQKTSEDMVEEESSTGSACRTDILSASGLSGKDAKCHQNKESTDMVQDLEIVPLSEKWLAVEKSELLIEHSVSFDEAVETEVQVSTNEDAIELNGQFEDLYETKELAKELQDFSFWSVRSQRSLFMHKHEQRVDQNNTAVEEHEAMLSTEFEKPNRGRCHLFRQIVRILYAIVLLGLGSQSLACSDDFFHGLML